jgi:hypothetical protein
MIYLINEVPNLYRWVSISENDKDWGLKIAKIKNKNPFNSADSIEIEWTPETVSRQICDFPVFMSKIKCISCEKLDQFSILFDGNGSRINLVGLNYVGFFCETVIDAVNIDETKNRLNNSNFGSFHSPRFAPSLFKSHINQADIFKIPESVSKVFVTKKFKDIYDKVKCTGLEFIPVELV